MPTITYPLDPALDVYERGHLKGRLADEWRTLHRSTVPVAVDLVPAMSEDTLPDCQAIEDAWKPVEQILERLPDNTERRRAEDLVKIATDYTFRAREKPADR